jgi:hypothetical protein
VKKQNQLDQEIEQAFQQGGQSPPDDKYFTKIWNTIECKAPVGEKYYLRSLFAIFFFLLSVVVLALFYSDFLSSVLTLKEIRKDNAAFFSTDAPPLDTHIGSGKYYNDLEIAPGVSITARDKASLRLESEDPGNIVMSVTGGHIVVQMSNRQKSLVIRMPDLSLTLKPGNNRCNIFCYDGIIRIIPITAPVDVLHKSKSHRIEAGKIFFLLNRQQLIIQDTP